MTSIVRWTTIMLGVMLVAAVPMTQATAKETEQVSPPGGIGNTRSDFEEEWGPLESLTDPQLLERGQLAYYETPDPEVFLSVTYQLENANRMGNDDRVILISLGWDQPTPLSFAKTLVAKYLPKDAKLDRKQENHFGYDQELYVSKSVATEFPVVYKLDESIKSSGQIWVTYEPYIDGEPGIGAIEIALYDDEA